MSRPPRQRIIAGQPAATVYKPAGVPARTLEWTHLALDEFEAIRLVDGERLNQQMAASQMGVSRPTVTRILASARSKIARVLIYGQAILIEGGPVVQAPTGAFSGRGRIFARDKRARIRRVPRHGGGEGRICSVKDITSGETPRAGAGGNSLKRRGL